MPGKGTQPRGSGRGCDINSIEMKPGCVNKFILNICSKDQMPKTETHENTHTQHTHTEEEGVMEGRGQA